MRDLEAFGLGGVRGESAELTMKRAIVFWMDRVALVNLAGRIKRLVRRTAAIKLVDIANSLTDRPPFMQFNAQVRFVFPPPLGSKGKFCKAT